MIFAGGARRQLLFAFAALLAVVLIGTGMGFTGVYVLSEEMAAVTTDQLANSARIARAQWGVWELRFGLAQYIINTDPQARAKIKQDEAKWVQTVRDNMAAYSASQRTEAEKRLLGEWNEAFKNYLDARPHWFELMDQGKLEEAADWRAKKTNFYGAATVSSFIALLGEQDKAASQREASIQQLQMQKNIAIGVVLAVGIAGLGVGILFGVMIVVANLRLSGFFSAVAEWVVEHAHRPILLLAAIVFVAGFFSAFFVNDTMCLVLTPLVLEISRQLRRNAVPYLLAVAMAANIGSVATITGNPQNMMIGSFSGIRYRTFAAALSPVAVIGLLMTVAVIAGAYMSPRQGKPRSVNRMVRRSR